MTYDPAKDAPQTQEQLEVCVDYWLEKEAEKAHADPDYVPATRESLVQLYSSFLPQETNLLPKTSLEDKKRLKLAELEAAFKTACDNATTEVNGLVINANDDANRNVDGLIKKLEALGLTGPVDFCLYNNSMTPVDLATLKEMQLAIITKGQELYNRKWQIRSAINAALNDAELSAIAIRFGS